MDKPLATFGILSFNQKEYLVAALKGALAQTYRPLEIVISDDGSSDGSWEYIRAWKEQVETSGLDIQVVIHQNVPNLGMFANWQQIARLASGEIIIKADGDDISLPERTERVVAAWVKDGKRASVVSNAGYTIDPAGRRIGAIKAPTLDHPTGALCNWTKKCYSLFEKDCRFPRIVDDVPYAWRARTIGPALRLDEALVEYRIGTGVSTSLFRIRAGIARSAQCGIDALQQAFCDIEFARKRISQELYEEILGDMQRQLAYFTDSRDACSGKTFNIRYAACKRLNAVERRPMFSIVYAQRLTFLLPPLMGNMFLFCYSAVNYIRKHFASRKDGR